MEQMSDTNNLAPLWKPSVVPPAQTVSRQQLGRTPEMRLVLAIFDDALECILRNADARHGTRRRDFVEARDWLWDDTRGWPFAFANVCDLLGFEATAVRERLETIVPGQRHGSEEPHRDHAPSATFTGDRMKYWVANAEDILGKTGASGVTAHQG